MSQVGETAGSILDRLLRAQAGNAPASEVETLRRQLESQTIVQLGPVATRVSVDSQFVRAGHQPENTSCDHIQYDSKKHGRYCPCGTCMWDAGD